MFYFLLQMDQISLKRLLIKGTSIVCVVLNVLPTCVCECSIYGSELHISYQHVVLSKGLNFIISVEITLYNKIMLLPTNNTPMFTPILEKIGMSFTGNHAFYSIVVKDMLIL